MFPRFFRMMSLRIKRHLNSRIVNENHEKFGSTIQNIVDVNSLGKWRKASLVLSSLTITVLTCFGAFYLPVAHMIGQRRMGNNFIADVVDKISSSVVMVEILNRNFFYGSTTPQSNGSGFIVKEDGLIVTSAHVVALGKTHTINIRLADNTTYHGTIEDVDMKADLATVRIKTNRSLPAIRLGKADDLRPGEWVVAIGSPLSLSNTITAGVVSTVHRTGHELKLQGKENMAYIQTDASLTFGNSGGPLVNLDGEVIGVNAMKIAAGISFAVPIEHARELIKLSEKRPGKGFSLLSNPKRYMGVMMLTLTPQMIVELNAQNKVETKDVHSGVLIWKVAEESPAYYAGLLPWDIVVELNGINQVDSKTVYSVLESDSPVVMKVSRGGKLLTVEVKPEKLKD